MAIAGEKHDGHDFVADALALGAETAIVSDIWLNKNPSFKQRCIGVADTTTALRRIAQSFRSTFDFPVIAIGGSNGKTTTKEMLATLLARLPHPVTRTHKSENGFLGLAMTLTQIGHRRETQVAALIAEIGIDATGAMSEHMAIAQPEFALLTALGPEHLNGLGSWEKAIEEELILFRSSPATCARIWQCCDPQLLAVIAEVRENDTLVYERELQKTLPADTRQLIELGKVAALEFNVVKSSATASLIHCSWRPARAHKSQKSWSQSFDIPLPGRHNANNFALALAAASNITSDIDTLIDAWQNFTAPEMRSRVVKLKKQVTLYDDCYNSSPSSLDAALAALEAPEWANSHKVLILGDMLDLGTESKTWHLKLPEKLLKIENSHLCLFGSAMYDVFYELRTKHGDDLVRANIVMSHMAPEKNPADFFQALHESVEGAVILVKGSRGMDLGRFVRVCEEWSADQG